MSRSTTPNPQIKCNALGYKASFDSWIDCVGFQIPFILETIGFGYICWILILIIIVISIFGKSKEQYRWFILNQAFWDLWVIYDYICEKPTYVAYFQRNWQKSYSTKFNQGIATCFYGDSNNGYDQINRFFKYIIKLSTFTPLLLLTFSRFLCLYFPHFYKTFFTTFKSLLTIVFVETVVIISIEARTWAENAQNEYEEEKQNACWDKFCGNLTQGIDFCEEDKYYDCLGDWIESIWVVIFGYFQFFIPMLFLLLSICFALLVAAKVGKQIIYQAKNNRTNLYSSLRITLVLLIQCLITALTFSNVLIANLVYFEYYLKHPERMPPWILNFDQTPLFSCLNIIRIFIDSILVIVFLSHYRKYCITSIKLIIWMFKNAKNVFTNLAESKNSSVVTISAIPESNNGLFKK